MWIIIRRRGPSVNFTQAGDKSLDCESGFWSLEINNSKKANIYIDFCFSFNLDTKQTIYLRFDFLLKIATFSLLADQEIQHLRFWLALAFNFNWNSLWKGSRRLAQKDIALARTSNSSSPNCSAFNASLTPVHVSLSSYPGTSRHLQESQSGWDFQ